jgi:hypothetical protein
MTWFISTITKVTAIILLASTTLIILGILTHLFRFDPCWEKESKA